METFFIVGAQKSGTTWLQKILNSVPGVGCFGESHFVDSLLIPIAKNVRTYSDTLATVEKRVYNGQGYYNSISNDELLGVMRAWFLTRLKAAAGDRWDSLVIVGDKTPAHSFHLPTLRALFPNTRFVHMLRDGRDAVVSNYHHRARVLRQLKREHELKPLSQEAPGLFLKWAGFTNAILASESNGVDVHTVRYEKMLSRPFEELRATIDHILPSNSIQDDHLLNAIAFNSFSSHSGGRSPGEKDDNSFVRKGVSGSWREELNEDEISAWNQDGLKLLRDLGYL